MKGMLAVETDELFAVELSSVEDVEVAGVVRVGFIWVKRLREYMLVSSGF